MEARQSKSKTLFYQVAHFFTVISQRYAPLGKTIVSSLFFEVAPVSSQQHCKSASLEQSDHIHFVCRAWNAHPVTLNVPCFRRMIQGCPSIWNIFSRKDQVLAGDAFVITYHSSDFVRGGAHYGVVHCSAQALDASEDGTDSGKILWILATPENREEEW